MAPIALLEQQQIALSTSADAARSAAEKAPSGQQPPFGGALPVPNAPASVMRDEAAALRLRFDQLKTTWKLETSYVSSMTKTVMHPAYQTIIGMGAAALPLIL